MNIPDEAYKAAEATYLETLVELRLAEGGGFKVASQQRRALRAALGAAVPHMLAATSDQGAAYVTREERDESLPLINPYRSQS